MNRSKPTRNQSEATKRTKNPPEIDQNHAGIDEETSSLLHLLIPARDFLWICLLQPQNVCFYVTGIKDVESMASSQNSMFVSSGA